MAQTCGVVHRTIDNWIASIPEFANAMHCARAETDARVARCLYKRATGYRHTVERMRSLATRAPGMRPG